MAHFFVMPFLPWSSVYAKALSAIVIFPLFRFIDNNNYKNIFFAGFISALAFYTRQPVGIVLFLGIMFLLVNYGVFAHGEIKITKLVYCFVMGFGSVILSFSIFFLVNGAFYDWWAQSLRFAFYFGFGRTAGTIGTIENLLTDLFFAGHWTFGSLGMPMIWVAMPVICIYLFFSFYAGKLHISGMRLRVKNYASQKEMMLLFFAVIAIALWHQYYPVPCVSHIYWASGIMIGVFVYVIWDALGERDAKRKSILLIMVLFLFFYGNILTNVTTGMSRLRQREHMVTIEFGHHLNGMMVDAGTHSFLYEYFNYIDRLKGLFPEKQFINYTRDGLYGITFGENLINMTVNWGNAVYPDYHANVRTLASNYSPFIVAFHHIDVPGYVMIRHIHHVLIFADSQTAELYWNR